MSAKGKKAGGVLDGTRLAVLIFVEAKLVSWDSFIFSFLFLLKFENCFESFENSHLINIPCKCSWHVKKWCGLHWKQGSYGCSLKQW